MLEPRRHGRRFLMERAPQRRRLEATAAAAGAEPGAAWAQRGGVARGRFVSRGEHAGIAALVVTYNSASDISRLIDDLRVAAVDLPMRLIVVDNQSSDYTVKVVCAQDDIIVVESGGNLGYAGGINAGLPFVGDSDSILILNPDLELAPDAVMRLYAAANDRRVGAVVPLILDHDGTVYPSLHREPSLTRALGDALLGSKVRIRPGFSTEIDLRPASYLNTHDVDWASGAALLVPLAVAREVGEWNEEFFLYSEETDYFRRIRQSGRRIRFESSAVVTHRRGGSGTSPELRSLMAVNRIRYIERHHGRAYSALFRVAVAIAEAMRSYDAVHRRTLAIILNRRRWDELPHATKPIAEPNFFGPLQRGAVIIPAYNEAAVIKRTLAPLSRAAVDGYIELVVVCNGCTDDTADVARGVPGARVLELAKGCKPAALNAGDDAATLWPRLYLDADIQISAETVFAVLDRLGEGDALVARPDARYDSCGASPLVRSYYRGRSRVPKHKLAMWGAGVYALTKNGHERFGSFPIVTGDDLYVDTQFDSDEKVVVAADPAVVKTPADAKSLLAILRRAHRADAELLADKHGVGARMRNTSIDTAVTVVRSIHGPQSAVDAAVYLGFALAKRVRRRSSQVWERDESSRSRN